MPVAFQSGGGSSGGGGISSINADTTAAQLITSDSAGNDVAVATAAGTTTISIPTASATARGVVSTGAQTLAGQKTFSSAPILSSLTATTVPYLDGSKVLTSSAVTPTELGYVSGVTSAIQTQLGTKVTKVGVTTDNAITRYDGTTGDLQNSSALVTDSGYVQVPVGATGTPSFSCTTAATSGMFFDGSIPAFSRSGVLCAELTSTASYLTLPAGQPQYGFYHENSITVSRGTTGTASLLQQKFGTRTFANTEYLFNAQGNLSNSITSVGNVGAGEDDLNSYTVKGLVLGTDKDSLYWYSFGTFAANGNNKQVRCYFNGTKVADSGVVTINNGSYEVVVRVVRTGSATQVAIGKVFLSTGVFTQTYAAPTATLSNDAIFKTTGEATSNDDVSEKYYELRAVPRGN